MGGGDALPLPFTGKLTMQEMGSFTPIGAKTAVPFINFHTQQEGRRTGHPARKGGAQNKMIEFFVPGPPQGKARARTFTTRTGRVRSCTPGKTVAYEGAIRSSCRIAAGWQKEPYYSKGTPVIIRVVAQYGPPKRLTKAEAFRIQNGLRFPTRKPDIDNVLKAVADALNGVAYHDDSQVVMIEAQKLFSSEEGVRVTVTSAAEENITN